MASSAAATHPSMEAGKAPSSSSSSRARPQGPAQKPEPAVVLVGRALLPSSHVDFPQITEICDRVEANPQEAIETVRLLVAALRDRKAAPHKKLKALTILNEMMYNESVVVVVNATDGAREALTELRGLRDAGGGDIIEENVRMLATEIEKRCNAVKVRQQQQQQKATGLDWLNGKAMEKFQKAKSLEKAFQNSELHGFLAKMERTVERKVNSAMGWQTAPDGKVLPPSASSSRRPSDAHPVVGVPLHKPTHGLKQATSGTRAAPAATAQQMGQEVSQEEWQLQWAIRESIEGSQQAPVKGPVEGPRSSIDEAMWQRLQEIEERETEASEEVAALKRQLMDSRLFITGLSERLADAEEELRQAVLAEDSMTTACEVALEGLRAGVAMLASCKAEAVQEVVPETDKEAQLGASSAASTSEPEIATSGSILPDAADSEALASTHLAECQHSVADTCTTNEETPEQAPPVAEEGKVAGGAAVSDDIPDLLQ